MSRTLHVLLLKRCTLVLQQWLCTLSTGVAVHGWFWLKLLKCMVQFSLVPRFSVGGENESLVSTVCACASIPRNLERSGTIVLYLYNRDFHNVLTTTPPTHFLTNDEALLIIRTPALFSALHWYFSDMSLTTVQVASILDVCW